MLIHSVFVFLWIALSGGESPVHAQAPQKNYVHISILSDLHLPGRMIPEKQKVLETLNIWPDLDEVAVLGDICEDQGSVEEYAFAKQFLSKLNKPFFPVVGNHDYIYFFDPFKKAAVRKEKLGRFKETFSRKEVYYSRRAGRYHLMFLSTDHLSVNFRTALSDSQLDWLRSELKANRSAPTIIFFHGPLRGTITGGNLLRYDPDNHAAQPHQEIHKILIENPQVFLWVSGHLHLAPSNANFNHPVNLYEGRVMNVHNCDMNGQSYLSENDAAGKKHEGLWTNSLFLYPDKVVIKTYDHVKGDWMKPLTRDIRLSKTP